MLNSIDQRVLINMNDASKSKLLNYYEETLLQYWFIVCDTTIHVDVTQRTINESYVQHILIKNLFGPLVFCKSVSVFKDFFATVTSRFVHEQMPILNNISSDRLQRKLTENVNFVLQFPAGRMIQYQPCGNLFYLDARDLFDIVKLGYSGYITNMRSVHITNEANFLDTWRRILFNFVHELTNIHNFERQTIRIRSNCNVWHFIKGNNKSVLPEFRCDSESRAKCIHLKTRRKEYEMFQMTAAAVKEKYTIALSDDGVICRHVLETMAEEYGEEEVDKIMNFHCFFGNSVYEHANVGLWQRVVHRTLDIDRRLVQKDGSSLTRERISCMQTLCNQRRMNDIHRFCLPRRFLTLAWFKWACKQLQIDAFGSNSLDENDTVMD